MLLFNMRSDITGITEEQKIPDEMGSFCGLCNKKKKRRLSVLANTRKGCPSCWRAAFSFVNILKN